MVGLKVLLCAIVAVTGANATGCVFGYDVDGSLSPEHWGDEYAQCAGKHQSPINIDSAHVSRVVLPVLKLRNFYSSDGDTMLTNNGHTVMMTAQSRRNPTISGGPLKGVYEFDQLHFHWGNDDSHGSEDEIDGKTYPMELHVVFFKKDYLGSTAALDHPDGLCVLAAFFEVGIHNHNYDGFDELLPEIVDPNASAPFEIDPPLMDLLPHDLTHYFTYNGSLTTPPCSEVVTWIDFKEPIRISEEQLTRFRNLLNEEGHSMSNNFRAIQPLGDREVFYNVYPYEEFLDEIKEDVELGQGIEELLAEVEKFIAEVV